MHTNNAFEAIAAWRKENTTPEKLVEVLDRAEQSLRARKALGRTPPIGHLLSLIRAFKKGEIVCDGLKAILDVWYERYMHLNSWIANGRDHLLAWKKDYYRRKAYELASKYQKLLLDADDFAKMAETPKAESGKRNMKNELRHMAAPHMLRDSLVQAFGDGRVLYSTFIGSSQTCSQCGEKNKLDGSRTFKCVCGYEADRELNATTNVMNEFLRKPGTFSTDKRVAEKLKTLNEQEALAATA